MKKTLCNVLSLLMVLALAACSAAPAAGGESGESAAGEASAATETSSTEAAAPAAEAESGAAAPDGEPFRVAMIMEGPINDGSWNTAVYNGLMNAEKSMSLEVAYSENVALPDAEARLADYASQNFDLVIAGSQSYLDATMNLAKGFPDTNFVVVNGDRGQAPNVASYGVNAPETGFLAGCFAALMTKSNVVGYMTRNKNPKPKSNRDGFINAVNYVNPDIKTVTAYTDTADDLMLVKEIAGSMIEQGADVIGCNSNQAGLGSIEACKEAGILAIGNVTDQHEVAPETVAASVVNNTDELILTLIQEVYDGKFRPELIEMGVKEGVVAYAPFYPENNIPQDVLDRLDEIQEEIKTGSLRDLMLVEHDW